MALEVFVTSGGTIAKIDDVRHLGNFSSGTTGSLIAESFLKNNAVVHYVYGKNAKRPFREALKMNPKEPKHEELKRLSEAYETFNKYSPNLHEYSILTFEDYYSSVKKIIRGKKIDVVVLAAAVGDYSYSQTEGKISSDKDKLTLEFAKNQKVISEIKEFNPNIYQVGFKLLSRVSNEELIDTAYKHCLKNNSDMVVANSLENGDFSSRKIFLVFPDKRVISVSQDELADRLVREVSEHYLRNEKN